MDKYYFKSKISKCSYIPSILKPVLAQGIQLGLSNKLILYASSRATPCMKEMGHHRKEKGHHRNEMGHPREEKGVS